MIGWRLRWHIPWPVTRIVTTVTVSLSNISCPQNKYSQLISDPPSIPDCCGSPGLSTQLYYTWYQIFHRRNINSVQLLMSQHFCCNDQWIKTSPIYTTLLTTAWLNLTFLFLPRIIDWLSFNSCQGLMCHVSLWIFSSF